MIRLVPAGAVAFILFIVDRVLKRWFEKNPSEIIGSDFFYGQLQFRFAKNFGIAFGVNFGQVITLTAVVLVIIFVCWMLMGEYKARHDMNVFGLLLVLFGAFSNLFDRVLYGYVVDYIDVPWFTVFNIADVMITCGVVVLGISLLKDKDRRGVGL